MHLYNIAYPPQSLTD